MGNMSYCRFRNTVSDLQDCYDNWNEELSEEEEKAKQRLIRICKDIADDEGIHDDC